MKTYPSTVVNISDLSEYECNSRTHSQEQIDLLIANIKEFGFTDPILIDEKNTILAGHARTTALSKMGETKVNAIKVSGLTDQQKSALVIANNQVALNAGWNFDALKTEIGFLNDAGFDLDLLGFDDDFLSTINNEENFLPSTIEEQGKLDELDPIFIECPHCNKTFNRREVE